MQCDSNRRPSGQSFSAVRVSKVVSGLAMSEPVADLCGFCDFPLSESYAHNRAINGVKRLLSIFSVSISRVLGTRDQADRDPTAISCSRSRPCFAPQDIRRFRDKISVALLLGSELRYEKEAFRLSSKPSISHDLVGQLHLVLRCASSLTTICQVIVVLVT